MRRLLITGGSGFVGGHLMIQAREDWIVTATYKSHPFSVPDVKSMPMNLEKANEIRHVVELVCPDVVIHCAAWSDVDECEMNRHRAFLINTGAVGILAETCSYVGSRLIYISSDMVFDGEKGNYIESDAPNPINIYGVSKLKGELKVKNNCRDHVIVRTALVYGQPITRSHSFSEKILKRIKQGNTVSLFVDQYRTPILVQNLANALLELADINYKGIIHLGGAERVDRYTFGLKLIEQKGFSENMIRMNYMEDIPAIAPRPRDVSLNSTKAMKLLSTNLFGYQEGLKLA